MVLVGFSGPERVGGDSEDQGEHAGGGQEVREGLGPPRLFHVIIHDSLDLQAKLT